MKTVKRFFMVFLVLIVLSGAGIFLFTNYAWVFSKRVDGVVVDVQRVTAPTAVFGNRASEAQMYSYSVLIQGNDGLLYTAASEDRQWQVVKKGYCIAALLYRYPPWALDKANTFFNARVEQIRICPGQTALPDAAPVAPVETVPQPGEPAHHQ